MPLQFLTPVEIAEFCARREIAALPKTEKGWRGRLQTLNPIAREGDNKTAYAISSLPLIFQLFWVDGEKNTATLRGRKTLSSPAHRRACRLAIVALFRRTQNKKLSLYVAASRFAAKYNNGEYHIDSEIRSRFETVSAGSVVSWIKKNRCGRCRFAGGKIWQPRWRGHHRPRFRRRSEKRHDAFRFSAKAHGGRRHPNAFAQTIRRSLGFA